MTRLTHLAFFAALLFGWASASLLTEGVVAESESSSSSLRESRGIHKRRCRKFGICGQEGYGGHGGGYGGHGGRYGGYGGYGGQGYPGQIPAINIGISQSQSSSSAGSGGYSSGYYPNNYQYNNPGRYGGYGGYGGYNQGGYGGYQRPGYYGNGNGGYNNQFNGNYYSGGSNGGHYGFQGPFGDEYSEDMPENDVGDAPEADDGGYASSGAFAYSRSASKGNTP